MSKEYEKIIAIDKKNTRLASEENDKAKLEAINKIQEAEEFIVICRNKGMIDVTMAVGSGDIESFCRVVKKVESKMMEVRRKIMK